jgi:hypothetical protein
VILGNLLQRGVERELKGLVLLFTHRVQASDVSITPLKPHGYWRRPDHTITFTHIKKKMWVQTVAGLGQQSTGILQRSLRQAAQAQLTESHCPICGAFIAASTNFNLILIAESFHVCHD